MSLLRNYKNLKTLEPKVKTPETFQIGMNISVKVLCYYLIYIRETFRIHKTFSFKVFHLIQYLESERILD